MLFCTCATMNYKLTILELTENVILKIKEVAIKRKSCYKYTYIIIPLTQLRGVP